jgi:glutamate 5-kinase
MLSSSLLVIKIGSSLVVDAQRNPRSAWMQALASDILALRQAGKKVILVSSGAVALGRKYITADATRTLSLDEKQAAAACGQPLLMAAWQAALADSTLYPAQILLTQHDTEIRRSYLNARNTLLTLLDASTLDAGVIPIINENDTVATLEIRYGDNDRLAARVAQMVGADALVLLSDIDGLYTANPNEDALAQHLPIVAEITPAIEKMAGGTQAGGVGSGGMITKIEAAKIATKSGCVTYLCSGKPLHPLHLLQTGGKHTLFHAASEPLSARQQWITGAIQPLGEVTVDHGAAAALRRGKSLLFAGVTAIVGDFSKGDLLAIYDEKSRLVAKGLSSYDHAVAQSFIGKQRAAIRAMQGEDAPSALVHRDNLVLEKHTTDEENG